MSKQELSEELKHILLNVARTKLQFLCAINSLIDYLIENGGAENSPEAELAFRMKALAEDESINRPIVIDSLPQHISKVLHDTRRAVVVDSIDDMILFPDEWIIAYGGEEINLTSQEFKIFSLLCKRPRSIFSRNQILDAIDPTIHIDDRAIDSHIKRIRNKFREINPKFPYIHTVYGGGYCLIRH